MWNKEKYDELNKQTKESKCPSTLLEYKTRVVVTRKNGRKENG